MRAALSILLVIAVTTDARADERVWLLAPAPGEVVCVLLEFAFSPSGTRIAAERMEGSATYRIVVISLEDGQAKDVGALPRYGGFIGWLDEDTLVFPFDDHPEPARPYTGLKRLSLRTGRTSWLMPPERNCFVSRESVSPTGGRLVVLRECVAGSWFELLRTR